MNPSQFTHTDRLYGPLASQIGSPTFRDTNIVRESQSKIRQEAAVSQKQKSQTTEHFVQRQTKYISFSKWRKRTRQRMILKAKVDRVLFIQSLSWRNFISCQRWINRWKQSHSVYLRVYHLKVVAKAFHKSVIQNNVGSSIRYWRLKTKIRKQMKIRYLKKWVLCCFLAKVRYQCI